MARLVILVGIPFASLMASRIKCKMDYLDAIYRTSTVQGRFKMTSKRWYEMKAMSSVCQAIGRVIRYKDDYGAIIFLEERMGQQDRLDMLSPWMRNQTRVDEDLKSLLKPLSEFFTNQTGGSKTATPAKPQASHQLEVLEPISNSKAALNRRSESPSHSPDFRGSKRLKTLASYSDPQSALNWNLHHFLSLREEPSKLPDSQHPASPVLSLTDLMTVETARSSLVPLALPEAPHNAGSPKKQKSPELSDSKSQCFPIAGSELAGGQTRNGRAEGGKCPVCTESNDQEAYFNYPCGHDACEACVLKNIPGQKTDPKKPVSQRPAAESVQFLKKLKKLACPTCRKECRAFDLSRNRPQ